MQRLTAGLGFAVALLLLANLYQFSQNARLEARLLLLQDEVDDLEAEAARTASARAAPATRPTQGSPPRAIRPPRGWTPSASAVGPGPAHPAAVGVLTPDRVEAIRQTVRGKALDRMLVIAERAGQELGWEGATIAEVQRILESSFTRTGELREQARAGEITTEQANAEVERVREERDAALTDLLGAEDYDLVREMIQTLPAR